MTKAEIDIVVNGQEKLKEIGKDIDSISTKSVAMGNIYAKVAAKTSQAIGEMIYAGVEWNAQIDEITNAGLEYNQVTEKLHDSIASTGAALMDATGLWDAYKTTMQAVAMTLETVTVALGGMTQMELKAAELRKKGHAQFLADEREKKQILEDATKVFEEMAVRRTDALLKEQQRAKDIEDDYQLAREFKILAHEKEIKIVREMINIYEEQGRSTDKLIKKLDDLENKEVNHKKSIRDLAEERSKLTDETNKNTDAMNDNTDAVDDNTGSIDDNTSSTEANTEANKHNNESSVTMEAGTNDNAIMGKSANIYADPTMERWRAEQAEQANQNNRYMKEIARNTRETNDAVQGG